MLCAVQVLIPSGISAQAHHFPLVPAERRPCHSGEGQKGDCGPSCAELWLFEGAFGAAWKLLGCVHVALASCLETEGAGRDGS